MSQVKTSPNDLILSLQSVLYKPCRRYFETILFGSLLTVGCITSWILAGSQVKQYKKVYRFIARIGKQVDKIQLRTLRWLFKSSSLFLLMGGGSFLSRPSEREQPGLVVE